MPAKPRPPAETAPLPLYRARIKRLRAHLDNSGVASLLITNPLDIRYLSPFCGDDSYALLTDSQFWIISDSRFTEDLIPAHPLATVIMRKGDMVAAVKDLVSSARPRTVGIQADYLTIAARSKLAAALGPRKLKDTSGLLSSLRIVKDDFEIAAIRHAVSIQEAALKATLKTLRAGQTESAIAARLEFEMKTRGSPKPSFDTIVAAGPNSSKPHAVPGSAKLARGGVLLIDWGATHGGYHSDMTRTFALGKWPAKLAEAYKVVLEAHNAALAAVAPGKTGEQLDAVARNIIIKAGYGDQFGHGLGHGIGLNIHEDPRLNRYGSANILRPGMVVTIEPGIYLPGLGGIRIEDDALVTKRGGEGLCTLPKDLRWATI